MITVIIFLFILTEIHCYTGENERHYDPSEEDPYRIKYLLCQDDDGEYFYENLVEPQITPRADPTYADVKFYLYTRNQNPHIIPGNGIKNLRSSTYSQNRLNVFLIHGWQNSYRSDVNTNIRTEILKRYDVNLFVVDWSSFTGRFYTTAFYAVPPVGKIVGQFIHSIMTTYRVRSSSFFVIGHSLGAHVSGCAGAEVRRLSHSRVSSIVGLDPAGPLFTVGNIDNRLDPTDANFVHIIHTNGGLLGFSSAIGHVDHYPNGGFRQPGCGLDIAGSCAHSRAHLYYAESIASGFLARKCDSFANFNNGKCSKNRQSYMGKFVVDASASGDYYLKTNDKSPFAIK